MGATNPGNVAVTTGAQCFGGICTAWVSTVSFGQITVSIPNWVEFSKANAQEQSEWTSAMNGLKKHENGHVLDAGNIHLREQAALKKVGASGKSAYSASQNINTKIRAVENKFSNMWNQWSSSYDAHTCHGECQ